SLKPRSLVRDCKHLAIFYGLIFLTVICLLISLAFQISVISECRREDKQRNSQPKNSPSKANDSLGLNVGSDGQSAVERGEFSCHSRYRRYLPVLNCSGRIMNIGKQYRNFFEQISFGQFKKKCSLLFNLGSQLLRDLVRFLRRHAPEPNAASPI